MGKVPPPVGIGGGLHQDLWEVLRGGGPVCPDFRIGAVGHNTPHSTGIGDPE